MNLQEIARTLLRKHALLHARSVTENPNYLPETDEEAAIFEPHTWAVSAVVEALKTEIKCKLK